jgi:hypothetical protein
VRFYGRYSNVCQGRKKRQAGCAVQLLAEQAQEDDYLLRKQCRSNWARLIIMSVAVEIWSSSAAKLGPEV